MSDVAADMMRRVGMNVDYQSTDWGTVLQRRTSRNPPDHGGWSAFCTRFWGSEFFSPAAHSPLRTRLTRLFAAGVALLVSAGWYVALVALWPADRRPYIGGSAHNSILELALGYNGFGRLTGDEPGGLGNPNFDVGSGRLFDGSMGTEIAWLIPASLICIAAALLITRRAPRTNAVRGACIVWGSWLVVTGLVISYSNGIIHPYYTVALAPAIAVLAGAGFSELWQLRSRNRWGGLLFGARADQVTLALDRLRAVGDPSAAAGLAGAVRVIIQMASRNERFIKSYAVPWNLLVPLLVATDITPPPLRPYCAS